MSTWKALAIAAAIVTSSCTGADRSTAPTFPDPPPETTTNVPTTIITPTIAPSGPTDQERALGQYLASLYEINAEILSDQAMPYVSTDLQYEVATMDAAVTAIAALEPPPRARELHDMSVDTFSQFADGWRELATIVGTQDPEELGPYADQVIADILDVAGLMIDVQIEQDNLTSSLLGTVPNDPQGLFIVEMLAVQAESIPATQSLVALLSGGSPDRQFGLEELSAALATLRSTVSSWESLDAPAQFEDLRRRSSSVLGRFVDLFSDIVALRGVDNDDPASSLAVELETLSLKLQLLNAERSRAVAGVLRSLFA
jgi:hypothetical protein